MEDAFYNSLKQKYTDYQSIKYEKIREITDSCPINTDNGWTGEEMFTYLKEKFKNHVQNTGQNKLTIKLFGDLGMINEPNRFLKSAFRDVKEWEDFCDWYMDSIRKINKFSDNKNYFKDKLRGKVRRSLLLILDMWKFQHPLVKMVISEDFYILTLSFTP